MLCVLPALCVCCSVADVVCSSAIFRAVLADHSYNDTNTVRFTMSSSIATPPSVAKKPGAPGSLNKSSSNKKPVTPKSSSTKKPVTPKKIVYDMQKVSRSICDRDVA